MKKWIIKLQLIFEHLPFSLAIGIMGWYLFQDTTCILVALLTGWFIDADHLFDFAYYACRHYPHIDFSLIGGGGYFKKNKKAFVLMHAWEITIIMLVTGMVLKQPPLLVAAMAHGTHLYQDQRRYRVRPLGYLLTSRIKSGFRLVNFCKEPYEA